MVMEHMKDKQSHQPSWQWVLLVVLFLALSRLIPHPPNFTPLGAMALLAGAYFSNLRLALLIPLAAMLVSDILLGVHSTMVYVYFSVAVIIVLSNRFIKQRSIMNMLVGATLSAILFFIITNFGAWLSHDIYAKTINGLQQAYLAGIPFFRDTLLSNLMFTCIGFYALKQLPESQLVKN